MVVMAEGTDLLDVGDDRPESSSATSRAGSACRAAWARTRRRAILTEVLERGGSAADVDERIDELEETLRLTSICGLGQVALAPVMSVLRMQRDDAPPPPAAGGRDGPPRG